MPRKKKTEDVTVREETWPKITEGTHSVLTEHEDGRVEMSWDWGQLNKEINDAIREYDIRQSSQTVVGEPGKKTGTKTNAKKGKKNELV